MAAEGSVTEGILEQLTPWMTNDLRIYLTAIGDMAAETEEFSLEDWENLLDPDLCPVKALPYLAQYVGERLPVGIAEASARQWIKDAPNQTRGTLSSIVTAAQRHLTGTKVVAIVERDTGADRISVITYVDQTPFPDRVRAELDTVVPADITINYNGKATGQSWSVMKANHTPWSAVKSYYPTWADVKADRVGGTYGG